MAKQEEAFSAVKSNYRASFSSRQCNDQLWFPFVEPKYDRVIILESFSKLTLALK